MSDTFTGGGLRPPGLRLAGDNAAAPDSWYPTKIYRRSVAASTTYNTYDTVHPWGTASNFTGWGIAGGALDPINVLNAYPHHFPAALVIKNILIKNNVGAALTKLKIGIYGNVGNGIPYPAGLRWENAELNPLAIGITTLTVNLPVSAGSLLWAVLTCDNTGANINLSGVPINTLIGAQILGANPAMTAEPLIGWQQTRTYDGTLPATFPTTAPTALIAGVPPALMMRLA